MIPKIQITDVGYNVPTTEDINKGVWVLMRSAFGNNISTVQGTPQYQLATSLTAVVRDVYDSFVELANQFDPRYADGIYQDAIAELYFMQRKLATHSFAQLTFLGLNGVAIPQGFRVADAVGNIWETTGNYNIGSSGTVTGNIMCVTSGAIEANPNSITTIIAALSGLDSVTNEDSAVAGYDEESRADFEFRRQESVALNGKMTDESVRGAVLNIRDVVDCYAISNPTDVTVTKGETDYPLIRNSIVVSVVGGNDYDVAEAAFVKAGTGCSWNGNTEVTIVDRQYNFNPPTYPIKILRPDFKDIYIKVLVQNRNSISYTTEEEIKNSILTRAYSGELRVRIGKNFIPMEYTCGLPRVGIKALLASTDGINWVNEIPIGIDEYPSLNKFQIVIEE